MNDNAGINGPLALYPSQATQCAGKRRELERPGGPYPFGFPDEQCDHGDGADEEHNPVATGIGNVFFVLFHVWLELIDGQK